MLLLLSLILTITHLLLSNLKLYIFDYATISSDVRQYYPALHSGCNRGFVCPDKPNTFVPFERLCDLDETCSGKICRALVIGSTLYCQQ